MQRESGRGEEKESRAGEERVRVRPLGSDEGGAGPEEERGSGEEKGAEGGPAPWEEGSSRAGPTERSRLADELG